MNHLRCLETYSRDDVLAYYAGYVDLMRPEAAILRLLEARLPWIRMLELGVGAGRITRHFAPLVADYRAIDLCPRMVEHCRLRFRGRIDPDCFAVGDMRSLECHAAASCELAFISYNTIDHLTLEERAHLLAEMRRIVSPGGYFCFSSHNSGCLGDWLKLRKWLGLQFWRHPRSGVQRLRERTRLIELNQAALAEQAGADYVKVHNAPHADFALHNYYSRPAAQSRDLRQSGFSQVRVFSLDSGKELAGEAALGAATDRWLYYLCA